MIETKFDDQKDREQALLDFKALINSSGWQRVQFIVNANIEVVKGLILNGLEGETKETIDRLRDKLRVYQEVIGTPEYWINKLEPQEGTEEFNDDPFTSVEEEKKNKDKV